jgi:hypothetical protein
LGKNYSWWFSTLYIPKDEINTESVMLQLSDECGPCSIYRAELTSIIESIIVAKLMGFDTIVVKFIPYHIYAICNKWMYPWKRQG